MIPALNDAEMEEILAAAKDAGAITAGYTMLRLPLELKDLLKEWLEAHFPNKASHVLSLVAQSHGGKAYDSTWGKRMVGYGPYADLLGMRFDRAVRRLGFARRHTEPLDTSLFRPPAKLSAQLPLF